MVFPFYRRLSKKGRAIYRKSDAVTRGPAAGPRRRRGHRARAIEVALGRGTASTSSGPATSSSPACAATSEYLRSRCGSWRRAPSPNYGELHGLYVREEGKRPVLQVWMRTAAHERVVAFRTFSAPCSTRSVTTSTTSSFASRTPAHRGVLPPRVEPHASARPPASEEEARRSSRGRPSPAVGWRGETSSISTTAPLTPFSVGQGQEARRRESRRPKRARPRASKSTFRGDERGFPLTLVVMASGVARVIGGRWEIERQLARGGMGVVYVARHRVTRSWWRSRCCSWTAPRAGRAPRAAAPRGGRARGRLGHPGLVRVFDAGVDPADGSMYLAMELLQGESPARIALARSGARS